MATDVHPLPERIVLVLANGEPECSGYLVSSRRVLTSGHGVGDLGERVELRMCREKRLRSGTVHWRGSGHADVALILLDDPVEGSRGPDPQWASCKGVDLDCTAIGYPQFQNEDVEDSDPTETTSLPGTLDPGAGLEHGFVGALLRGPGRQRVADWEGMSGAAMFVEGMLVGVIVRADKDRLDGWPVERLGQDERFADAFDGAPPRVIPDSLWPRADQPLVDALERWETPRINKRSAQTLPSVLLQAKHQVVPFDEAARADDIELLRRFVDGPQRESVLVITAPGGVGKTRLMLQFCRDLRAEGWLAGFLRKDAADLQAAVKGKTNRLVVLDYPETEPAATEQLLQHMIQRHGAAAPRMRVVLLARQEGPWLSRLRTEIGPVMDEHEVHALPDLYRTDTARRAGFHIAWKEFAPNSEIEADEAFDVQEPADDDVANRALYVHMRALLAAQGGQGDGMSAQDVLDTVLAHEKSFWKRWIEERSGGRAWAVGLDRDAERMAAAVVLCGSIRGKRAGQRFLEPVLDTPDHFELLWECLSALYGAEPGARIQSIAPLEPDMLGEALVARVLQDAEDEELLGGWLDMPFGEHAPAGAIGRTLTVLSRMASRKVGEEWLTEILRARGASLVGRIDQHANRPRRGEEDHKETLLDPEALVFAEAIRHACDGKLAAELGDKVPLRTVELREVEEAAYGRALALLKQEHDEGDGQQARLLALHGRALGNLGRREEALDATREAVDHYRALAEQRPDAFLPDLASALNNLGAFLSNLGRWEEALDVTREAVDHYRALAEQRPDAFLPDLAMALNNLGAFLSNLGRWEEALDVTREAVDHYRALAEQRPDAFLPNLATALNNLGMMLSNLGRWEEALDATREAVEIRRALAEQRPDAFLPDLAMALNNLGIQLSLLGRREEALDAIHEAIKHHRALTDQRPETFLPNLVVALETLGFVLLAGDSPAEALLPLTEGLRLLRPFFERLPAAFEIRARSLARQIRTAASAAELPIPEDLQPLIDSLDDA